MSQNTNSLSLSIFSWQGYRPTPVPFASQDDNFADIDLSNAEVDALIYKLIVARTKEERVTLRLGNDEYEKEVERLKELRDQD
ncbi:hypothetical protein [Weissella paramesenteroides]|uniref:hypothetical protein n=1 Tax=Weissella paramesenteroides TaxID=1249 RepID=UPI0013DC929E|nr:hypothetical protein [Weissella paramesenteroides]NEZ89046.1 hypothetical protein [Weissella paramesenteroides]NFB03371.1 hypothetical protein [Weissella paramesenteroides]